ncbi:hypothetical protein L593_13855 [Salinarchaeum sp. Harcht-Bsk1]|nr:hypothetical protein L593_13855 [Salinarchaeum sp. Harcht-Bsk1]
MCGGIRAHLRMCGHDTVYALDRGIETDEEILALAHDEGRTIVSRDRDLVVRADDAILLESTDATEQLATLASEGIELQLSEEPTRCGRCNGRLGRIDPSDTTPSHVPDAAKMAVWQCRDCGQCFWKGSHWERVAATLEAI